MGNPPIPGFCRWQCNSWRLTCQENWCPQPTRSLMFDWYCQIRGITQETSADPCNSLLRPYGGKHWMTMWCGHPRDNRETLSPVLIHHGMFLELVKGTRMSPPACHAGFATWQHIPEDVVVWYPWLTHQFVLKLWTAYWAYLDGPWD